MYGKNKWWKTRTAPQNSVLLRPLMRRLGRTTSALTPAVATTTGYPQYPASRMFLGEGVLELLSVSPQQPHRQDKITGCSGEIAFFYGRDKQILF
jgi:hypothetical protein